MPTGANIREFTKVYREARYESSGSLRLSEIEHNAYLQRLTLEITHEDASRSINFKTLPENTHWGYLTSFKGSSVASNTPIKFTKQRVFELINQGIWAYHQNTESVKLSVAATESGVNSLILGGVLGGATEALIRIFVNAVEGLENAVGPALAWLVGSEQAGENGGGASENLYTAFPVASPFPDVFKFKSDIPCSFLFRLESWYLVNPIVYITSSPTDTSDETEDENEYPEPQSGDGSGGGENFPAPSERDPSSDPRDYSDGEFGDQGTWTVQLNYFDAGNNPPCNQVPITPFVIAGYANSPPVVIVTAPPNETGAPAKSLQTALQTLPIARDCGVAIEGEPVFTPGQVVFP